MRFLGRLCLLSHLGRVRDGKSEGEQEREVSGMCSQVLLLIQVMAEAKCNYGVTKAENWDWSMGRLVSSSLIHSCFSKTEGYTRVLLMLLMLMLLDAQKLSGWFTCLLCRISIRGNYHNYSELRKAARSGCILMSNLSFTDVFIFPQYRTPSVCQIILQYSTFMIAFWILLLMSLSCPCYGEEQL